MDSPLHVRVRLTFAPPAIAVGRADGSDFGTRNSTRNTTARHKGEPSRRKFRRNINLPNSRGGTRTRDPGIMSAVPDQLSYPALSSFPQNLAGPPCPGSHARPTPPAARHSLRPRASTMTVRTPNYAMRAEAFDPVASPMRYVRPERAVHTWHAGQAPRGPQDLDEWRRATPPEVNLMGSPTGPGPSAGDDGRPRPIATPRRPIPHPEHRPLPRGVVHRLLPDRTDFGTLYPAATGAALAAGCSAMGDSAMRCRMGRARPGSPSPWRPQSRSSRSPPPRSPRAASCRRIGGFATWRVYLVSVLVAASSLNPEGVWSPPTRISYMPSCRIRPSFPRCRDGRRHTPRTDEARKLRGAWERGLAVWRLRPNDLPQ